MHFRLWKRRKVVTLLSTVAATWPLVARAQQAALPVVGLIHGGSPTTSSSHVSAFRRGLNELGYIDGKNVTIEYRWAEGHPDRYPELAADLIRQKVNVIATGANTTASRAVKAATATIPIVFGVGEDPVKLGLVASLARPGGNATGINFFIAELAAKRLGLLREMVPGAARVAVLVNPANATTTESTMEDVEAAAPALGLQIQVFNTSKSREIDSAFASLVRQRFDALFVGPDPFFNTRRVHIALTAARHAVPTIFPQRNYAESGGLMSYGANVVDAFRQVGNYTGRILKGEKPADLPVVQSTKGPHTQPHGAAIAYCDRRRGDRVSFPASAHGSSWR
jgi:putative ABC transport system substrate-binding protein